jgi:hypothetical protein
MPIARSVVSLLVVATVAAGQSPAAQPADKTVTLIIDFGGAASTKQFDDIPWRERMTVLDAMKAAHNRCPGVRFEYRGSGATAFLTKIDDVKNEGAGGRNWLFRVNDKLAERSFGVVQLKANDRVNWEFGKQKNDEE